MSGDQDGPPPPTKPRLKLVNRSSSLATASDANVKADSPSQSAVPATPGADGPRKVKLKVPSSQPATPVDGPGPVVKTKAGRQPKPTQKLVDSKKRPAEDDDEDDVPLSQSHPAPKIKIRPTPKNTPRGAPQVLIKQKGKPPYHPPGDGYDSEASDREIDPAIEEQLILRLPPGEHADYVRKMMDEGKIGVPKAQGGADFYMRFFDEETRRACVHVKGQAFAAVVVDLPTITEAMKTWDRKSLMKSADICQMLLAFQKVKNEEEAKKAPLPSIIDSHFKWPHGLTPPMHDCVNRRFAKTISRKEIEDKEAEVERLLAEDAKARSTRWEWIDDRDQEEDDEHGMEDISGDEEEEEEEDAEGEVDDSIGYFGEQDDYGDLEDAMEAAFADAADDVMTDTPAAGTEAATPMTATQIETPGGGAVQASIEADESEEDGSDDDDDDDDSDMDDDERAQRDEEQGIKDIIADMQKQLAAKQRELAGQQNRILKGRIENQIRELKSEIELKMSSIGMEADE